MSFWSAILRGIIAFFSYLWSLFLTWGAILIAPIISPSLLWIIVPVWLSWFFSEFFQEKRSTSFGNAIANGVVPLWVGIDWTRFLVTSLVDREIIFNLNVFIKFIICIIVFMYGLLVIVLGIKANFYARYVGRIREITYVILMFTPIIYGVVKITFTVIFSMILFFPLFYYMIELVDYYLPDPEAVREDNNEGNNNGNNNNFQRNF